MTRPDDIEELKAAMTAATPRPDPARRAETLRLAAESFAARQGSSAEGRPTPADAPRGFIAGVKSMFANISTRGALVASTAVFAGCVLVLTPQGRDLLRPVLPMGQAVPEAPKAPEEPVVLNVPEVDPAPRGRAEGDVATMAAPADGAPVVANELRSAPAGGAESAMSSDDEAPMVEEEAESLPDTAAITAPPSPQAVAPVPLGRMAQQFDGGAAEFSDEMVMEAPPAPMGSGVSRDALVAPEPDTEAFPEADPSSVKVTTEEPVSTFSIDVDTASWSIVRSSLSRGQLPPRDAVRIEEMVNYFPYDYPAPEAGEAPFRASIGVMDSPWAEGRQLVHIGLQGEMPALAERPPLNLVFLIDTSGSMEDATKLPLLIQSFRLMLSELRPDDEVAIVTYAGSAGVVLEPTRASERQTITDALQRLSAGGSTNGQGGLQQAYATAEAMMQDGEIGRVILATDGDFNVGIYDPGELTDYIEEKRDSGTYLSVLGFGRGNLDDATMQALAQNGNGTAAYIDTLNEAQKVLVDQLTGSLFPIADDVKVQVEFNPAAVAEYRLIGYETRALRREDFNNDAIDAGELGAGHSVTAIYEVTPIGSDARMTDPLRYGSEPQTVSGDADELGFLKLRYKEPGEDTSQLLEQPILPDSVAGTEARFAASIAGFGELLRGSDYLGDWGYDDAIALANDNRGEDAFGYRSEAVQMMRLAQSLDQ
ncbi:VWA domain-containing protein [Pelagovum pacificum]|uniref:DUF3520 domain-containing protein n=1 Tax=Pelagovum pacificum TaxID=2588711 RepID=A0A5C5GF87_9RHOB|nr:VWA domain-containing protein [Pelagovum pacificum]QQA43476.1 von Willebrand factor type A domain-containing protein [Pelagovum pacificum]TNY33388.1 DUF3520 domain-containing protein [Pelagovum pacificum]